MKKPVVKLLVLLLLFDALTGCGAHTYGLDPNNPITITMWHNYGGQMKDTMDALITEFNNTVGRDRGIAINVTSIQASKDQNEKLAMIARGDPGAPEMPDIATAYPSMALLLREAGLLAPLDDYFTEQELSDYVDTFVAEGRLPDGKLYVFPISKSTEALFVNKTLFDRFSQATGVTMESLSTFEGIARAAAQYYAWTDAQTPDVPNDGKTFFTADSWFNIAQVGSAQLGEEIVAGLDKLNTDSAAFQKVWDFSVLPALNGAYAVVDGYSSDLSRTGEIICSIGSTAGILFYGDSITYPDNTKESVEYSVLPYPVFEGGKKIALQRGAGMIVAKSSPQKEYAATLFLKWFTSPKQNMRFVSSTGYLPVTREAYEQHLTEDSPAVDNPSVQRLLKTATLMHKEYAFVVAPQTESFSSLSEAYEKGIRQAMRDGRQKVLNGADAAAVSGELFSGFIR
ncbi:MAG: extracellular solute-binding protein [Christensenellales bacterium]